MSIEDKIRVQSFNKSALIRLAILFALLLLLGIWVWFMMFRMRNFSKSRGTLASQTQAGEPEIEEASIPRL